MDFKAKVFADRAVSVCSKCRLREVTAHVCDCLFQHSLCVVRRNLAGLFQHKQPLLRTP